MQGVCLKCLELVPFKYLEGIKEFLLNMENRNVFNIDCLTFLHCNKLDIYGKILDVEIIDDEYVENDLNNMPFTLRHPLVGKLCISISVNMNNYSANDIINNYNNLIIVALENWLKNNIKRFIKENSSDINELNLLSMFDMDYKIMNISNNIKNVLEENNDVNMSENNIVNKDVFNNNMAYNNEGEIYGVNNNYMQAASSLLPSNLLSDDDNMGCFNDLDQNNGVNNYDINYDDAFFDENMNNNYDNEIDFSKNDGINENMPRRVLNNNQLDELENIFINSGFNNLNNYF